MIESLLITSRETLEASLVIGIVLAHLTRTKQEKHKSTVFTAIFAAIITSIVAAIGFSMLANGFSGKAEELFEGITMLIGASLLTTMIVWMARKRNISASIHKELASATAKTYAKAAVFLLVFFAILREGVETVIFLNAAKYAGGVSLIGSILGVIIAISIGVLFFYSSKRMQMKTYFTITSVLLILFAAGLFSHSAHEFQEAGVLPGGTALYDISHVLSEESVLGSFAKGLFGYSSSPSALEIIVYLASALGTGYAYWHMSRARPEAI